MVHYDVDEDMFYIKSFAFIPAIGILNKEKIEHVPYRSYIDKGFVFVAKGKEDKKTINYNYVAKFVENLEEKYGVNVLGIGYDPYNANSCVSYWEDEVGYQCEPLKQHSSVLYPPTKALKEYILNEQVRYERNDLLEINFEHCRTKEDENKNLYVTKKHSTGKIDMVVSIIDAMYFWKSDIESGDAGGEDSTFIV